jgi:hypothetical protein
MMPTQVKIIRASDFLVVTPKGQVDFEKSKRLLMTIGSASATLVAHEILLDMRSAQSELSATDLWHLAAELSRRRRAFPGKIAVLCRFSGSGQAAFFALCAQNRGFPVSAFTSFEDAVEWLSADGPRLQEDLE